jgi:hypothetical protein
MAFFTIACASADVPRFTLVGKCVEAEGHQGQEPDRDAFHCAILRRIVVRALLARDQR